MLTKISGIGSKTLENLKKMRIETIEDLITFFPFRHEILKKTDLTAEKVIIEAKIMAPPTVFYFNYKKNLLKLKVKIDEKIISVDIYNRAFLKNQLKVGDEIVLIGKYQAYKNLLVASELLKGSLSDKNSITPIYHQTAEMNSKKIHKLINNALKIEIFKSKVPKQILEKYDFLKYNDALNEIHNPQDEASLERAITRLKYEELFVFMLKINYLKQKKQLKGIKRAVDYDVVLKEIKKLSFELTKDQLQAVSKIHEDLNSEKRMNRLLQGDVGSGKTIVAFKAVLINYLSGYTSTLMVPTEVLAHQHYQNFKKLYPNLKVVLLTSSVKNKKTLKEKIKATAPLVIIGTHALLTEDVIFNNLGLVITDEQHRFGVNQRANLMNKGIHPDILYMSATPIPRTYALTIYGDMDISNIKTMPKGRQTVKTFVKTYHELRTVLEKMLTELKNNHQIYVITPLVEESEKVALKSVETIFENMQKAFGHKYQIGLLHGRLKANQKQQIIDDFYQNKLQILVSTTVVEVGIDVPNATMIVIYDSQMFGLATLHQLRGRVGRSHLPGTCTLLTKEKTKRLSILENLHDGFLISEADFKMRGSGDIFGIMQSGDMNFKIANIRDDFELLLKTKEDSELVLKQFADNPEIKEIINQINKLA